MLMNAYFHDINDVHSNAHWLLLVRALQQGWRCHWGWTVREKISYVLGDTDFIPSRLVSPLVTGEERREQKNKTNFWCLLLEMHTWCSQKWILQDFLSLWTASTQISWLMAKSKSLLLYMLHSHTIGGYPFSEQMTFPITYNLIEDLLTAEDRWHSMNDTVQWGKKKVECKFPLSLHNHRLLSPPSTPTHPRVFLTCEV